MRVLLLMRGAPGVGKSTYIEQNGLKNYALSADDIRMMHQSPLLQVNGKECISPMNEKPVWETLFRVLEERMKRGEFVVIDATNSKTQEMNRYKDLTQMYRYRIYCIDFTDVPIDECKRRNKLRPEFKQVPEEAIDKMYSRFATQKIPAGIKVLKPDELDKIWFRPIDLSGYKKIHHIGDIHGCYTALKEYLADGIKDDEYYIFHGDYIDRGIENVEVINFLSTIYEKPNVLLLEGNHERWLWIWAHGGVGKSKEFESKTRQQLQNANVDATMVRKIYRKFAQCAYYTYHGKTVLATHAGISRIPNNLTKIATEQMILGVGRYSEYVETVKTFESMTDKNTYQIFGHRNTEASPVHMSERTFNLKGRVEFGGCLRVVTLDENGFKTHEIKNNVFAHTDDKQQDLKYTNSEVSVMDAVNEMRHNKFIQEKKFGNISSFNFTRDAFYDKKWNEQTIKARGLFIDTALGKVVARSYPKFFNVNERPETRFNFLRYNLTLPITAYVKENGFLAMVSYDAENDDFLVCSKSTVSGPFVSIARNAFMQHVNNINELKEYLMTEDCTLVFECVDNEQDPHIIEYDKPDLFLLDIVKNEMKYSKKPYSEVINVASMFGFTPKTKAVELHDWNEFVSWYDEIMDDEYLFNGRHIEGFVIEDAKGFMVKVKLQFYTFWKHMRSVAEEVFRSGNYRRMGSLTTPTANFFYRFCMEIRNLDNRPNKIISLRNMFYEWIKQEQIHLV